MAIRFSNGFGIGASNSSGPYGANAPWNITMNIAENNTTAIIFAGVPFSFNDYNCTAPGYASGWNSMAAENNGGAALWEFDTFSYQQFSTPQSNLLVTGDCNFDINNNKPLGLTVIGDALIGDGASPSLGFYETAQNSSDNTVSVYLSAPAYSVIVVAVGSESNNSGSPRNVTGISGMGLTWSLRKKYSDPNSDCGQQSEIWYAINNSSSQIDDTITVTYDSNFDDEAMIASSWTGCDLNNPWTSSNSSTSNTNKTYVTPSPSPTPSITPTPSSSPIPLTQYTPNGTNGGNGLITNLDRSTGLNGNDQIPDLSGNNVDYAYTGSNPYTVGLGYSFGSGNFAYSTSNTLYNQIVNSVTIEIWFKVPTNVGSRSLIAAGDSNSSGWALRLDGGGTQINFVKYNIADQTVYLPYTIQANTWHHLVVAQGGTSLMYVLDGEIVGSVNDAAPNNISYSAGNLNISKDFYTATNYDMTLGSLKIYDYCRLIGDIINDFDLAKVDYGFPAPSPTPSYVASPTPTPTLTPTPSPTTSSFTGYSYTLMCGPGGLTDGDLFLFSDTTGTTTYDLVSALNGQIAFSVKDDSSNDHTSFYSGLTGTTQIQFTQGGNVITFDVTPGGFSVVNGGMGGNLYLYDSVTGSGKVVLATQVGSTTFTCGQSVTISIPVSGGGGSGSAAWYFYSDAGALNAGPPNGNGNAIFIDNDTSSETFNPNKSSGVDILYFDIKDSSGTDYTTQFSAYTGGTGTITISQNADTATYTSTTPGSFIIQNVGSGNSFFSILTANCTQTKDSNAPFVYADPISITFS